VQFKIHELDNGKLDITAETKEEVVEIIHHFKLDLLSHAHVIGQDTFTYTENAPWRNNGQWFHEHVLVQPEFTKPYRDLVERWTGYEGPWDIELPPTGRYGNKLGHTHYLLEIRLKPDGVAHHKLILNACDTEKASAHARAGHYAKDMANLWWGERIHHHEYVQNGSGHMVRNPHYMKVEPPTPRLNNTVAARAMFNWWLTNVANEAQRECWAASNNLHQKNTRTDTVDGLMRFDTVIRRDWEKDFLTPEQFINLK
jgi:hypothetical protein